MRRLTVRCPKFRRLPADGEHMTTGRIWVFVGGATSAVTGLVMTYGTTVGAVLYLITYVTMCVMAWTAVARVKAGPERRPWVPAAAAPTVWLIGDTIGLAYHHLSAAVPPAGVTVAFRLAGYVLLARLLVMALSRGGRGTPARLLLGAAGLHLAIDVLPLLAGHGAADRIGPLTLLGNALLIAACLHPDRAGPTRPAVTVRDRRKPRVQHDPLTGLAGRTVLIDRLERPGPVAVLRLDLDGFKEVGDTYGQEAGDLVLSTVARRLSAAVRASDLVVRLDGDEFVLLCPGLPQAEAIRLAERILGDVARPIEFRGTALDIGANVGIVADTPDRDVLRRADTAMHEAKREGRGRWMVAGV
jgi:diguanylate cyclase (GGDEF)-like protein